MKLKTIKYVFLAGVILMVLLILLYSVTRIVVLAYAACALAFVMAVFWGIFGRCPSCGRGVGRAAGKYCPHCGDKLDW